MINGISSALSGLAAAAKKVAVAADNIANEGSTSAPAASTANGGVQSEIVLRSPASVAAYDPGSPYADSEGMIMRPDIDTTQELMRAKEAEMAYKTNAVVMARIKTLQEALNYSGAETVNQQA